MKSYITIRDKCNLTNQSNISSRIKDKYSEIRFMKINININSYFPRERKNLNRVKTYMEYYLTFRSYKIINHNYSIYNFIKNNQKIRNSIYNMIKTHIYPIDKHVKITPKLTECLVIKK